MITTANRPRIAAAVLSLSLLAAASPAWSGRGAELPPDPGAAGRVTLAGIDTNDNGVRDDLERYIAQHFGHADKVQRAVANAVIATQYGMLATDDDGSRAAQAMLLHVGDCMGVIGAQLAPYGDALLQLRRLIADTPQRHQALEAHLARVTRMDDSVPEEHDWTAHCAARIDQEEDATRRVR